MKLLHPTEPRPTRARAGEALMPMTEPVPDSPIPWEAMAEAVKPQFFEFVKRNNPNSQSLVAISEMLLLFPELEQELRLTQKDFERLIEDEEEKKSGTLELFQPLLRIFPKRKQHILEAYKERVHSQEKQLEEYCNQKPPPYAFCLYLLSRLPDHFDQYKDMLSPGTDTVLEDIRQDDSIQRILTMMSELVLFFPDTRSQVQSILNERRVEVRQMLGDMMGMMDIGDPDAPAQVAELAEPLACLKIIYAGSAGYRPDGSIYIEDKKRFIQQKPTLPARDLAL